MKAFEEWSSPKWRSLGTGKWKVDYKSIEGYRGNLSLD